MQASMDDIKYGLMTIYESWVNIAVTRSKLVEMMKKFCHTFNKLTRPGLNTCCTNKPTKNPLNVNN